jgi:hypothetical protein
MEVAENERPYFNAKSITTVKNFMVKAVMILPH